jgi:hypothetical protein
MTSTSKRPVMSPAGPASEDTTPRRADEGVSVMISEDAMIGMRVKVREDHRSAQLRGERGTIKHRWGAPDYAALDVLLDNGSLQLFWFHELRTIED